MALRKRLVDFLDSLRWRLVVIVATVFPGWVRRRARIEDMPHDRYVVRLARNADELTAAFRLVRDMFVRRGYASPDAPPLRMMPQHVLREAQVFVALEGEVVVATMTVTLDTEAGLPIDEAFPEV